MMVTKWMPVICVAVCTLYFMACQADDATAVNPEKTKGGFTGPSVPALTPILGDYVNIGVRTDEDRTDIPKLMGVLKEMSAQDYMHLVWNEKQYPGAWQDFQLMAPMF